MKEVRLARTNVRRRRPATTNQISAYLLHHLQSLIFSLGKIYKAPTTTIMTVTVIGITLSLPGGFYLFLKNIDAISGDFRSSSQISLYLELDTSDKQARGLERHIAGMDHVASTRFISREQSLEDFRRDSGFGKSIDTLSSNPLPHTIIVEPGEAADTFIVRNLLNRLQAMPEVEIAKLDTEWLERLYTIIEIAKRSVAIVTILFACAVLLIIGNTIRLDIENRREEIEVTKLIGASNAFVRRPFLWTGFWYGLLGGAFALLLVQYGLYLLREPVSRLAGLYQGKIAVASLGLVDSSAIIGVAVFLGLFASWVTAARHMRRIEPR